MLTFDEVAELLDDIVDLIPSALLRKLNGGINLSPDTVWSNDIPSTDYFVMGQYQVHPTMGRIIYVYYGSFMAVYPDVSVPEAKDYLAVIVKHELQHHLEGLAGVKDLDVEDALFVKKTLYNLSGKSR